MDAWATLAPEYDKLDEYVRYARRFVLDPYEAEDLCHAAFMDLKKQVEGGAKIKKPAAFLRRAIRCNAQDHNDREDTKRRAVPHLGVLAEARQMATASEAMFNVSFNDALAALPEQERSVFVLQQLRGLSQQEVAVTLGMSQQTVSRVYESARRAVAEALS